MVDADRRPTAHEIEELIDVVRRNPTSPAFVTLAGAYLVLGRPTDAMKVASLGLAATAEAPDDRVMLDGRMVLARAHAALHQWKEAQEELLQVVKVDRANRKAFALLGEVLIRRADYARAVLVLQHAQNLDPSSPHVLAMLRRARESQPLDPPPPVPRPVPPRGETHNPAEIQRSGPRGLEVLDPSRLEASSPAAPAPARPSEPVMAGVEGVKPRIIALAKPQNPAAAALRQSASVGETYLGELVAGGLFDIAGVRVPDVPLKLRPERRWRRSTRRKATALATLMTIALGGGGTWYWWREQQTAAARSELQRSAAQALASGDDAVLAQNLGQLRAAITSASDRVTRAYAVAVGGLVTLILGEARIASAQDSEQVTRIPTEELELAVRTLGQGDAAMVPGEPGYRELVLGQSALELARLPIGTADGEGMVQARARLDAVIRALEAQLVADPEDRWAHYLYGRGLLARGDRHGALTSFATAGEGEAGVVIAMVEHGGLLAENGDLEGALAQFDGALKRAKDHPFALIARALARTEASVTFDATMLALDELHAKFKPEQLPSRVAVWRQLALATAYLGIDEYGEAAKALAEGPMWTGWDPRYWARLAWAYYRMGRSPTRVDKGPGDLAASALARANCVWFGDDPKTDPSVALVDAALTYATGQPNKVLEVSSRLDGGRVKLLRGQALIDLGKPLEARKLAEEVLAMAPGAVAKDCDAANKQAPVEARTLCEQARMMSASSDEERLRASEALTNLASATKNHLPGHALGVAYLVLKDAPPIDVDAGPNLPHAKKYLGRAIDEISPEQPNPVEYRTLTALAEIALVEGQLPRASELLERAHASHDQYLPVIALQARLALRKDDPRRALELLNPLVSGELGTWPSVQLILAEALVARRSATARDRARAAELLRGLKDASRIARDELVRIAKLFDSDLASELAPPAPAPPPRPATRRRRGR